MSSIRDRIVEIMKAKTSLHKKKLSDLERRRMEVSERLVVAAINNGLQIGQDKEGEEVLIARVALAITVRVSEAEALAELAEFNGDLTSAIQWWQVRGWDEKNEVVLWQGYAKKRYLHHQLFVDCLSQQIEFVIRQACSGEYVTAVMEGVKSGRGVAIGLGKDAVESFERAYMAYFSSLYGGMNVDPDEYLNIPIPPSVLAWIRSEKY